MTASFSVCMCSFQIQTLLQFPSLVFGNSELPTKMIMFAKYSQIIHLFQQKFHPHQFISKQNPSSIIIWSFSKNNCGLWRWSLEIRILKKSTWGKLSEVVTSVIHATFWWKLSYLWHLAKAPSPQFLANKKDSTLFAPAASSARHFGSASYTMSAWSFRRNLEFVPGKLARHKDPMNYLASSLWT